MIQYICQILNLRPNKKQIYREVAGNAIKFMKECHTAANSTQMSHECSQMSPDCHISLGAWNCYSEQVSTDSDEVTKGPDKHKAMPDCMGKGDDAITLEEGNTKDVHEATDS
ncbi:hypothetical protein BsWGS_06196 [Bradybaena similaris]